MDNIIDIQKEPKTRKRGIKAKIPTEVLVDYKSKGLNNHEIARLLNCSPQNIQSRLRPFQEITQDVEIYKKNMCDVLLGINLKYALALAEADFKRSSLSQLVMGFGITFDKWRLASGQSTQNYSVKTVISDIRQRIADIKAQIQSGCGQPLKEIPTPPVDNSDSNTNTP